ncbi:MAG: glycoside hydrolase family 9 protein [Chitinophagaceae bacterium]
MRWFFFLLLSCCAGCVVAQQQKAVVQLNQAGFYPAWPKIAIVTGEPAGDRFFIVQAASRDTVFAGLLSQARPSAYSSVTARVADFSRLQQEGDYDLLVPGAGGVALSIRRHAYHAVATGVLKGFYYQRSDMPLDKAFAGKWSRPAGHPDTAVLIHASAADTRRPAGTVIRTPGGWYDAGDYNKYIVNSGITMGTLFSAYEDFPTYFDTLQTAIPESGDALPDILDETIYNLRWMLTMQDRDGGVYHKCTNAAFDGMVMPGVTTLPRYVVQKGTAATLDFAAVAAQAARVIRKFEKQLPGLADSCLAAAQQAWQWALLHPDVVYDQRVINPAYDPDITTGEYGDRFFHDEWLWAAAELFAATGKKGYHTVLEQRMKDRVQLPGWSQVGMLGYYTLVRNEKALPAYSTGMVHGARDSILIRADEYLEKAKTNAFATVMGQSARDFVWGSNAVAANQGMLLLMAYRLSGKRQYLEGALSNADYLLGRNATGYCFVTGYGTRSPVHPHHRPSVADGIAEPVPGLLAGGPNPGRQDHCTYAFTEPETAYTDDDCSYASNEIAINWNAPAVYLLNALEALAAQGRR